MAETEELIPKTESSPGNRRGIWSSLRQRFHVAKRTREISNRARPACPQQTSANIMVKFRLKYQLQSKEDALAIIGSPAELGQWSISKAVKARNIGNDLWETAVHLTSDSRLTWSCVTLDSRGRLKRRESAPKRRKLTIEDKSPDLCVTGAWNRKVQVIRLEEPSEQPGQTRPFGIEVSPMDDHAAFQCESASVISSDGEIAESTSSQSGSSSPDSMTDSKLSIGAAIQPEPTRPIIEGTAEPVEENRIQFDSSSSLVSSETNILDKANIQPEIPADEPSRDACDGHHEHTATVSQEESATSATVDVAASVPTTSPRTVEMDQDSSTDAQPEPSAATTTEEISEEELSAEAISVEEGDEDTQHEPTATTSEERHSVEPKPSRTSFTMFGSVLPRGFRHIAENGAGYYPIQNQLSSLSNTSISRKTRIYPWEDVDQLKRDASNIEQTSESDDLEPSASLSSQEQSDVMDIPKGQEGPEGTAEEAGKEKPGRKAVFLGIALAGILTGVTLVRRIRLLWN